MTREDAIHLGDLDGASVYLTTDGSAVSIRRPNGLWEGHTWEQVRTHRRHLAAWIRERAPAYLVDGRAKEAARDRTLVVRVTEDEHADAHEQARQAGVSLSDLVRARLFDGGDRG